ncbi:MAG: FAD-dependent protein [Rikenellaceae bacterium]
MSYKITLTLTPKQAADSKYYTTQAAHKVGLKEGDVALLRVVKRSIDARQRQAKVNLTVELFEESDPTPPPIHFDYPSVVGRTPVIVVGAGPAGLFAALHLIELGLRPIILERGRDVSSRKRDIALINRNEGVDPNSNYAFGEGGAGTFSDGKLFTRSKKRGDYHKALQTLLFHGATEEILYEAHPHIGTDKLPRIMTNMRQSIVEAGGDFIFEARVTDLKIKGDKIEGVWCDDTLYEGAAVILATGHSAKDIYELLHTKGVTIEAKPFAMGVRIEHPQGLIDSIQYHAPDRGEYLPAASYSLVSQEGGRGVYSFCMCPGGFIVPAMTHQQESVVNGMSPSQRSSPYANSGLVTEVRLSDFAHLTEQWGELAGLKFQQELEHAARINGGENQIAPAQRVSDFVAGRGSTTLPQSSYIPGFCPSRLDKWLPNFIGDGLRAGLTTFNRRLRGFITPEALVAGVESRTSSPVRIPRDPITLMHTQIKGLFPAGEGAGYAGGIISAALDGERIATAVGEHIVFKKNQ